MGVYCENFVMIGLTADAGDNFKNQAPIPFAPCMCNNNCIHLIVKILYITTLVRLSSIQFFIERSPSSMEIDERETKGENVERR